MKGLALEVLWGLIIAIAGVAIFLALVTGTLRQAANWIYCSIYLRIVGFFGTGSSTPEICRGIDEPSVKERFDFSDNRIFARELLARIITCWMSAEAKGLYVSHPCYELELTKEVQNVTERNVTDVLMEEDFCRSIENSDYGCAHYNQILWSVDGTLNSMTEDNVSATINAASIPAQIPVTPSMIPPIGTVATKLGLKGMLEQEIPDSICDSLGTTCNSWNYNRSLGIVTFDLSSGLYNYSIDSVTSDLEGRGLIDSPINDQKIILIRYDGPKDAVEVMG